jgi:hypothetical protein
VGVQLRPTNVDTDGNHTAGAREYTLSGVVNVGSSNAELLETIAVLRDIGAAYIDITPLTYRFEEESQSVRSLHERLKRLT